MGSGRRHRGSAKRTGSGRFLDCFLPSIRRGLGSASSSLSAESAASRRLGSPPACSGTICSTSSSLVRLRGSSTRRQRRSATQWRSWRASPSSVTIIGLSRPSSSRSLGSSAAAQASSPAPPTSPRTSGTVPFDDRRLELSQQLVIFGPRCKPARVNYWAIWTCALLGGRPLRRRQCSGCTAGSRGRLQGGRTSQRRVPPRTAAVGSNAYLKNACPVTAWVCPSFGSRPSSCRRSSQPSSVWTTP